MTETTDAYAQITMELIQIIFKDYHPRDFAIRLWDNTEWAAEAGQSTRFTIILNTPGALRKMFIPTNQLSMGRAYAFEEF